MILRYVYIPTRARYAKPTAYARTTRKTRGERKIIIIYYASATSVIVFDRDVVVVSSRRRSGRDVCRSSSRDARTYVRRILIFLVPYVVFFLSLPTIKQKQLACRDGEDEKCVVYTYYIGIRTRAKTKVYEMQLKPDRNQKHRCSNTAEPSARGDETRRGLHFHLERIRFACFLLLLLSLFAVIFCFYFKYNANSTRNEKNKTPLSRSECVTEAVKVDIKKKKSPEVGPERWR